MELWLGCILLLALVYIPFSMYARYKYYRNMIGKDVNDHDEVFELYGHGKSKLQINLDEIIYIKSDDNYVDIVSSDKDGMSKTLVLRTTLNSIEDQLKTQSQFARIHRSYIVNLRFVSNFEKKESIKIHNEQGEIEIPISRKYLKNFQKLVK